MEEKYYYVYKWYNIDTGEVFYIGKGCRGRSGQVKRRNQIFQDYVNTHNCKVEKIEFFDDEQEALQREHELILEYKLKQQCVANLDDGGTGGLSFIWTEEMKKYKSEHNPMKDEAQKERMRIENPMKNPKIAEKVSIQNSRPVIINGIRYRGVLAAAKELKVAEPTICDWCTKGYDAHGSICRYEDELNKIFPPYKDPNSSKQIMVSIDNNIFPSLKDAAKAYNFSYVSFSRKMKDNNGNTTYKNHICKYVNQQPSQENNQ